MNSSSGNRDDDKRGQSFMGFRIGNDAVPAILAQTARHVAASAHAARRLAVGLRIDDAAADPAGLAMAERLRAKVRACERSRTDANEGIALAQTAEGALAEATSLVQRLRELATKSSQGAVAPADRAAIATEFDGLVAEVNRIGKETRYGGEPIFGKAAGITVRVGPGATVQDFVNVASAPLVVPFTFASDAAVAAVASAGARSRSVVKPVPPLQARLDELLDGILGMRQRFGAFASRLQHAIEVLARGSEDGTAALGRLADADVAHEVAERTRHGLLADIGLALLTHAGASEALALRLLQ